MNNSQPNNPLHGLTLEKILNQLVKHYGWQSLGQKIKINCFNSDPSIKSSLKFLRRAQWARDKVEELYIQTFSHQVGETKSKKPKPKKTTPKNPWQAWETNNDK